MTKGLSGKDIAHSNKRSGVQFPQSEHVNVFSYTYHSELPMSTEPGSNSKKKFMIGNQLRAAIEHAVFN